MLHVVLFRPEIPPNTGNIGRLTLGTDTRLHIVGEPGFRLDEDTAVKRAGLDYWADVDLIQHDSWEAYCDDTEGPRVLITKFGDTCYSDHSYADGTHLIFGGETRGAPQLIHEDTSVPSLYIPMNNKIRSYNLANSVAVVLFEALRQTGRSGLEQTPYSS